MYVIVPYFDFTCSGQYDAHLFSFLAKAELYGIKIVLVEGQVGSKCLPDLSEQVFLHLKKPVPDCLWVKENLINLGVKALPSDWESFAFVDCDIHFCDVNWAEKCREKLKECDIIQPWSSYYDLTEQNEISLGCHGNQNHYSYLHQWVNHRTKDGNTGFAWAMSRSFYDKIGCLFDKHIMGGGDAFVAFCLSGKEQRDMHQFFVWRYVRHVWWALKNLLPQYADAKVGYLSGSILHAFHGDLTKRNYHFRHLALVQNRYHPEKDLCYSEHGVLQFSPEGRRLAACTAAYFEART